MYLYKGILPQYNFILIVEFLHLLFDVVGQTNTCSTSVVHVSLQN